MAGDGRFIIQTDIAEYPWGGAYRPRTDVRFSYLDGEGFQVTMRCYESGIRAVCTTPDSPVYEDSCMECFLNFYPLDTDLYMNFEVNSNGTMLCQVGTGKQERRFIRELGLEQPTVCVDKTDEYWEVRYLIPVALIQAVYGKAEFEAGQIVTGNFYKCGDLTEHPHYGCWSWIESATPNYHLPEFFGEILL